MVQIEDILTFWFQDPTGQTATNRKEWFIKDPTFDGEIRDRFLPLYELAVTGQLEHWQATAQGTLALILVLDQFPRNLFRGDPRSFATDGQALALTQMAIANGFDQALPLIQRWFVYLPLMHSEDLEIQNQSVAVFQQFEPDPATHSAYPYAIKHRDVIQQFGRFPHRNAILGRESTAAEVVFLQQPGSSF